jgi:hypothetical protein
MLVKTIEINEYTRLPLGIVVSGALLVVGFTMWLTVLHTDVANAKSKLEVLDKIERRLYRIEIKLGVDQTKE